MTGSDLKQLLCALRWLKNGIPFFSELASTLHEFMRTVYQRVGNRTERSAARAKLLSLGWGESERSAFEKCKTAVANQVTLSHRNNEKRLSTYYDASNSFWSSMITQIPSENLNIPRFEQLCAPLAFFGRLDRMQ